MVTTRNLKKNLKANEKKSSKNDDVVENPPKKKVKTVGFDEGEPSASSTPAHPPVVDPRDSDGEDSQADEDSDGEGSGTEESTEEDGEDGEESDDDTSGDSEEEEEETEHDGRNQDRRSRSGAWSEVEAIRPKMYFKPELYSKSIKLPTRCLVEDVLETFGKLDLTPTEREWFEQHPQFCHLMHMPRGNHMVQPMWMMLLRTAAIERRNEAWFVVNGVPIRYGLREHALISGLECGNYPLNWKKGGNLSFKEKYWPGKDAKVLKEDVKKTLVEMGPDDTGDRLKMAILFFLSSIIYCPTKSGNHAKPVHDIFLRYVADLDLCRTFPWGRFSFDRMLESIKEMMDHFEKKELGPWPFPGFCIPLELLAVEAIPQLRQGLREPVQPPQDDCPRMCKSKWKKCDFRGWPLDAVNEKLGDSSKDIESILTATLEEKLLLDTLMEKEDDVDEHDPVVASWESRLHNGFTVEFEEMREEDVNGRQTQVEAPTEKPKGRGPNKAQLGDVVSAMQTLSDQLSLLNDKVGEFDSRLMKVEQFVKGKTPVGVKGKTPVAAKRKR